ncbi:enoyl-CoA hydratase/carnithine racemase [Acidovorax sp. 69]|uniref:enoyl-CoA hydratase/isomerase family protein n=1 Tax=Acidovorax sp. 69 TaxID=2035202 RepID=UPI000C242B5E|nr:enoyl-CoA hydratase/isomerase family protein [Acidovorax sp. 69]PJI98253.1 enoyl-CoA hydratase/carnithine racemase [Acidovorax sp. 69]
MSGEVLMDVSEGGVVHVTLRHPGRLNAMSRPMWRQLRAVFDGIQRSSDVRCVLIVGEGGAFCAGGDISEYPGFRFDAAALRDFHENDVWGGLNAMLMCDVPIVAQISGACMGAGVEIASCCDIRIAGSGARFGAPIAKLGFPMAPREAQLVAGAVGDVTARQMLLEAATFSAPDMLARGFLSRVVPDDMVATEAAGSAQRIAALAPQAARMNKQTFRALKVPVAQEIQALTAIETIVNGAPDPYGYAHSAEHREGITAFLDKRTPVF